MKLLLFDQNLSPRLVDLLSDLYPNSTHVSKVGLDKSLDQVVWKYAHDNDYVIVTKDADFSELGTLLGFPPKVIWIRRGICSTRDIEVLLRENYNSIKTFSEDTNIGTLTLF